MTPGRHREMVEMNDLISGTGRGQDEHVSLEYLVVTVIIGIIKDQKSCLKGLGSQAGESPTQQRQGIWRISKVMPQMDGDYTGANHLCPPRSKC